MGFWTCWQLLDVIPFPVLGWRRNEKGRELLYWFKVQNMKECISLVGFLRIGFIFVGQFHFFVLKNINKPQSNPLCQALFIFPFWEAKIYTEAFCLGYQPGHSELNMAFLESKRDLKSTVQAKILKSIQTWSNSESFEAKVCQVEGGSCSYSTGGILNQNTTFSCHKENLGNKLFKEWRNYNWLYLSQ